MQTQNLSLEAFKSLKPSEQYGYFNHITINRRRVSKPVSDQTLIWLPFIYHNTVFPTFTSSDGSIEVTNKIVNGHMKMEIGDKLFTMIWIGYASELTNGQLHLFSLGPKSHIVGCFDGEEFVFEEGKLVRGIWPGFLVLYE